MTPLALLALLALLLSLPGSALAAILSVDTPATCPGQGTAAAPFCGLKQALQAAQCGDTIRLRATAPYPGDQTLTLPRCTPSTRLTIEAELYQDPIWQGDLTLLDGAFVTVRGLTIKDGVLRVQAKTQAVEAVWILGNRLLGGSPTREEAALHLTGTPGRGLPVVDPLVRGNLITDFQGTGIRLTAMQGGEVSHNVLRRGRCRVGEGEQGQPSASLVGLKITTGMVESLVQAYGTVISDNELADFAAQEGCQMAGIYCDVGPSDLLITRNRLLRLGAGWPRGVRGIRAEARCNRFLARDNILIDVGGGALWVNGPNRDVTFDRNTVIRPGSWCAVVEEGFKNPLRAGVRRALLNTHCEAPGVAPVRISDETRQEDPDLRIEGNSWQ